MEFLSSLRTLKFGPSTRSRFLTTSAPPSAPTIPRLWQPEQRSTKSFAPGSYWAGTPVIRAFGCLTSFFSWPHPMALPAAIVTAARTSRGRRYMRPGIIRDPFMRRLAALPILGALTLAGGGGGLSYTSAKDGVLKVTLDEYRIRPENFVVPAGRIHIEVTNAGRLAHNLAIESFD